MSEPTRPSPELLLSHSGWVWQLARRLTADPHQAEDVVQETWLAALRSGPSDPRRLPRWLAVVIRNFAGHSHRGRERRSARERNCARPERVPAAGELCERAEAHGRVVAAVLELEEPYRTAILMRYLDELPPRRIAEELGVPVRTVNTRIARGLARLRSILEAESGSDCRAWLLPLLPAALAKPSAPLTASASAATLGAVIMNAKLKLALWAALLIVLSAAGYRLISDPRAIEPRAGVAGPEILRSTLDDTEAEEIAVQADRPGRASVAADAPPEVETPAPESPYAALTGRVIDPHGEPVPGARVAAKLYPAATFEMLMDHQYTDESSEVAGTETDEDGRFELSLLRSQPHHLEVEATGFARTVAAERYGGQFVVVRMQAAGTLFGFVTRASDDTPVPGAWVRVTHGKGEVQIDATTDARGAYRAEGLIPGSVGVMVVPVEEALGRYHTLQVPAGQSVRHDVSVESGQVASGRVIDAIDGLPIAGAEVSSWNFYGKTVRTDELGFYRLAGIEARTPVSISVRADGYGRSELAFQPEAERQYDFALMPELRADGRVVGFDGEPVADAYVAAVASDVEDGASRFDWLAVRSGPDGTFELRNLRRDVEYGLFVRKTSFATLAQALPEVDPNADRVAIGELVLGRPASLEGRVVDSAGKGLSAWVNLIGPRSSGRATNAEVYSKRRILRADGTGLFQCTDLGPGLYEVRVATIGRPNAEDFTLELDEGQALRDVELVLPDGLSVEGIVLDPHGAPLARVEVGLSPENGEIPSPSRTRSLADGSFRITGLPPGRYTLSARLWGEWPGGDPGVELAFYLERGVEPGGAPIEVVLQPERELIRGRVEAPDGSPLAQAFVFVHAYGESPGKGVLTDDEGRFELHVAETGPVELRARYTRHLAEKTLNITRLEVLVGREILEPAAGEARLTDVLPGHADIVLTMSN